MMLKAHPKSTLSCSKAHSLKLTAYGFPIFMWTQPAIQTSNPGQAFWPSPAPSAPDLLLTKSCSPHPLHVLPTCAPLAVLLPQPLHPLPACGSPK